jgi:hypothetical protein
VAGVKTASWQQASQIGSIALLSWADLNMVHGSVLDEDQADNPKPLDLMKRFDR